MFMERMDQVNPERFVVMYDNVTPKAYRDEEGRLVFERPDGKLNLFVLCPEDDSSSFRGYAGRLFVLHHHNTLTVTTNMWQCGTIRPEVSIDQQLISICLTNFKWHAIASEAEPTLDMNAVGKYCSITKVEVIREWWSDGWHYLEANELEKKWDQSKKYLAIANHFKC